MPAMGAVVTWLKVTDVLATNDATVLPAYTPVPDTVWPATTPVVELTVTTADAVWLPVTVPANVRDGVPPVVTFADRTNVVEFVTDETVGAVAFPVPVTVMPATIPVVDATVTFALPVVVVEATPERPTFSVAPDSQDDDGPASVNAVPVSLATVVLDKPVPEMVSPAYVLPAAGAAEMVTASARAVWLPAKEAPTTGTFVAVVEKPVPVNV